MPWHILALLALPALSLAQHGQAPLLPAVDSHGPDVESARENAPHIFNAIHSSMRQWGSSLKHNGMSFFPAIIPASTTLYHGRHTPEPVTGMEWLAFEIEHAEMFARGGPPGGPGGRRPPGKGPPGRPGHGPLPSEESVSDSIPDDQRHEGYLHTYRTNRELSRILYIDGMSGGKTAMGTLDTQDIVLRNSSQSTAPHGDFDRAQDLCDLGKEWDIEGFLRMEAGFELILCNFTDGLDFLSAKQRPRYDEPEGYDELSHFEYARGVAARYQGITAERVTLDYSSMVSAFFYRLNLTNPDESKSELPRLVSSSSKGINDLRSNLLRVLSTANLARIDWQGVLDMIVSRYSDRLQFMAAENTTRKEVQSEVNFLLTHFIDYNKTDIPAANESCIMHYLKPVICATTSDRLIYEAIISVSKRICGALFEVRGILDQPTDSGSLGAVDPKSPIKELISYLDWTTWLECGKCAFNEVCYTAIWPFGSSEDHYHPRCLTRDEISTRHGYWNFHDG